MARRHGLTSQQLFTWRRLARRLAAAPPPLFVPAVVDTARPEPPPAARRSRRRFKTDGIELEIAGVDVRVGADANWPLIHDGVIRLSVAQLQALLEGLEWRRVHEPRRTTVPTAAS